jgi:hypothetical protein
MRRHLGHGATLVFDTALPYPESQRRYADCPAVCPGQFAHATSNRNLRACGDGNPMPDRFACMWMLNGRGLVSSSVVRRPRRLARVRESVEIASIN